MSDSQDLDKLLSKLTRDEKISLLAAADWWRTQVIKRDDVFVPHVKFTDGHNGARGESYVSGIKAACFPCGTSLGATFDRELLFRTGKEIAREAQTKAANVLLAPTMNVIRSPRGGRNYETYSEDPFVLGALAAAFVNGCQSIGIAATPKHYVANDTENNRKLLTADIDEQTLREIYMLPFQLLMRWAGPLCFMTSYNRVNGKYVADNPQLVNQVLRGEWGFDEVVVSDWMGVYSTADSINAGVDLEMPGPTRWRGEKLARAVNDGHVAEQIVDESSRRILQLACRLKRFELPEEPPEDAVENPERDEFICDSGAESMILLKDENILPLPKGVTVALIGHHAMEASLGGGGSARVYSLHAVSPKEGLDQAGFQVKAVPGVPVFGSLPHADPSIMFSSDTKMQAKEPVNLEWFNGHVIGKGPVFSETKEQAEYMIKEKWPDCLSQDYCTRMTFGIRPLTSGEHILSIISTGPAVCYINGDKVFERPQETDLRPESFYFFKSRLERRFTYPMQAGQSYTLMLESWNTDPLILHAKPLFGRMFQGSALRFHEFIDIPSRIEDARTVAQEVEYAIVCVGTTNEIESEGFDWESIDLSSLQYEQIAAVAAVNPRTIVVNFSGGPVGLNQFINSVPAVVQAWFPGQEAGHSLARVLGGDTNPGGRLPFSWPRRDEDNPSFPNFPCDENNVIRYAEGLDVGNRYYDRPENPEPLFPFGFGLSYTYFKVFGVCITDTSVSDPESTVVVSCRVRNIGIRRGATVIQYYVSPPRDRVESQRPLKELKEFRKLSLQPGEVQDMSVTLDKYSVSSYNAQQHCWEVREGQYKVHVGLSSTEISSTVGFHVGRGFKWRGL
ncbi:glycoside hydrolase family 3 protein [Aspergillus brunneoviolaceus CBS 621.78]|uniref:Glycoside hydrolase n=1 Tax=Aspergillus brunneoviolaceus CBS 621.78 TaxID=1450534 RepID=A0ACD1GNC4_9EURO|nr:glycoside hydrolase [Aspergillus brunneoviolaceus CBS 621.78]RAH50750.1 glycoside hydrolase [Aspergillus brunneoviolaceus CBS 621.78]